MGFFRGMATEAYDRQYSDRELVRRIATYFRPHLGRILGITGVILAVAVAEAAHPLVVARGLDMLVASPRLDTVLILASAVLVIGVISWGGNWIRRWITASAIADVVTALRRDAFQAAVQHDMSFFDEFRSGRIISRITSDTEEFSRVTQLITDILSRLVMVVVLVTMLFSISWRLTLVVLVFAPLVFAVALGFRRIARSVTKRGFRVLAEVNAAIQEAVTGISVAKNFRQEAAIYDEFIEVNRNSYRANLRRGYAMSSLGPILDALAGVGTAVVTYSGGLPVTVGTITIGSLYLFVDSVRRFWFPVVGMAAFWSQLQGGLSAAERIFALIDAKPTVQQTDNRSIEQLTGEIRFKGVNFKYTDQEQILQEFSLHIAPGESVALVGHTGSGKTSIARLIARFYEFQEGRIDVSGHDIRALDLQNYRQQLGIVSQMPFLFSGTVADNIRYARPNLTNSEIEAVARQIGEGEWLDTLPAGLSTDVGERGSRLSMGQRQLVALMRVLVQSPAIFILDEATASIDPFTEAQIQEAMELILQRSTSILIAHRLSTVRAVDRIIVLKEGQIIEEGNHDELMTRGGHYAELYDAYFRHQSLDYRPPAGEDDFDAQMFLPDQLRDRDLKQAS
ncbi:MAG: ABC transporter ATP-binding protein [Chloroflexi bacterium]|nr:ABC transporter ATP-binding protein [Chloroflexota bacterium]